MRLLIHVVEAISEIWGLDRVGVRLSPLGTLNDISDDDPETTFGTIAENLSGRSLAYLHIVNPAVGAIEKGIELDSGALRILELIRERYRGTFIIAGGFDHDFAEGWLQQGKADLIAFGRRFLANPDLPGRFRERAPLNADDPSMAAEPKGIPTIPLLPGSGARNRTPALTKGGDNADGYHGLPNERNARRGVVQVLN